MLFKQPILDGIAAGRVTLAFRRWKRPTVRAGGTLMTSVGVLAIDRVDRIDESDITSADGRRAGYGTREELLDDLNVRREGLLYRIDFRRAGADPRVTLRNQDALTADDRAVVRARLQRLDAASRRGPWTAAVLHAIAKHPGRRAAELAAAMQQQTDVFKANVRKLKNLGLTESLEVGYRLSPRGRAFIP